jgi:hypothetical protein
LVKLVFAAPANFFSAAWLSQAVFESRSHFFMKLVSAAPWSFLASAVALQVSASAGPAASRIAALQRKSFIVVSNLAACGEATREGSMTELERKRDQMIAHLEQALALADELHDNLTGYLIERALDEAQAGNIVEHARKACYS